MKLVMKKHEEIFSRYPFYSQYSKGYDATVLAKFFNPIARGEWYVTEAEKQKNGDWKFYGLIHTIGWFWGFFELSYLENLLLSYNKSIERDLFVKENATIKELLGIDTCKTISQDITNNI